MSFKRPNSQRRILRLDHKLEIARGQIQRVQTLRLWTGTLTVLGFLFSAVWPRAHLAIPTLVFFAVVFPVLVRISRKWNRYYRSLSLWRDFEVRQEMRRAGVWKESRSVRELEALDSRGVAADLDLFGFKSLFTQIDETFSRGGSLLLGRWMTEDPSFEVIQKRQMLLKDLGLSRWFFLRFRVANPSIEEARFSTAEVLNSLRGFPQPTGLLLAGFVGLMASWFIAAALVIYYPGIWGLFIAAHLLFILSVGKLLGAGEGALHHFGSLAGSFEWLESSRAPRAVQEICGVIRSERPARRIHRFEWPLMALTVESHPLVYLIVNFFLPWSSLFSFILIYQVAGVLRRLEDCFVELENVEALTSLVVMTTDQTSVFPRIKMFSESTINSTSHSPGPTLQGRKFYHPLIEAEKRIANDFGYASGEKLILLTGSNMSGKSTFLRTIGINQVLANMGAPVFASEFSTYPFRLRSCIRVSDSLDQGFSYFYAEVQRLRSLIEDSTLQPPALFLIDEIFRGTNNRERLIGSRSVIRYLLGTPALGFVTTHDLELTSIASGEPRLHNYHFRDEAISNRMHFDYQLHDGPSPTTNALKIMKQAGLPIED